MGAYAQPTEQAIGDFRSMFPDISRSEVIARLKNNNCNVEQAINEYFDNIENPNKYQWDETQFGGERDGGTNNHNVSFDIQGPDDVGPYRTFDGAMSRPPSRMSNNKSPMGKIIDLSADAAAADPRTSKTWTGGDSDLQRAIAASQADMGYPQETGVTSMDEPHFGPANRGEYEQGKWEMVPVGKTSTQEILLDPEPAFRKREYGSPAFLKPSSDKHPLAALFTIYHAIPKAREVFIDRLNTLQSYGFDKEWWAGSAIEVPIVIDDDMLAEPQVNREIQRLMAFLDKTERSYGSIQALANQPEVREYQRYYPSKPIEHVVMESWKRSLGDRENQAIVNKLFSKGVPSEGCSEGDVSDFAILELSLPADDSMHTSFYDLADDAIWPSLQPLELDQCPFLSHVADVVVFKIVGSERRRGVDVPATWYPDRYLRSGKEAALEMRLKKKEVMDQLERITYLEDRLTNFQMRGGKVVKVKDLFNASLQHDEAVIENGDQSPDPDMDMLSHPRSSKSANLSAELRRLVESIDKKLLALNVEREKTREALTNLSNLYTAPSLDDAAPKLHPYSLRGVSTNPSTMYVCERAEPDLMDMNLDSSQTTFNNDQWWRIHYSTSGTASWDQSGISGGNNPVTVEKTTEEKVLEAAKNECENTILVYANESAMEHTNYPLPTSLDAFVRADNRAFKAEFVDDIEESSVHVSSPGKRKFDEQSEDESQDSTSGRWSGPGPNRESSSSLLERELSGMGETSYDGARSASRILATRLSDDVDGSNNRTSDIIVGMDPSLQNGPSQEMQERGGNMGLSFIGKSNQVKSTTIDSMDLNDIVEDAHVVEESGAVKRVGFAE